MNFFSQRSGPVLPRPPMRNCLCQMEIPRFSTVQLTIDRKPAPVLPERHAGGRPRLPLHMQTLKHEYCRAYNARRRAIHRKVDNESQQRISSCRRITSPPLPFKRVPVLVRANALTEWHATCPGSMIFPASSPDTDTEEYPPSSVEDEHRYLSSPPLLERRSHHDE